jgi:hypothetical protein
MAHNILSLTRHYNRVDCICMMHGVLNRLSVVQYGVINVFPIYMVLYNALSTLTRSWYRTVYFTFNIFTVWYVVLTFEKVRGVVWCT